MGIVEGITEFLPISSTGHLILAGSLLNFTGDKVKVFEIAIQGGAMLAVIWEYRVRIASVLSGLFTERRAQRFALNLVVAFLPAAALGFVFNSRIKEVLIEGTNITAYAGPPPEAEQLYGDMIAGLQRAAVGGVVRRAYKRRSTSCSTPSWRRPACASGMSSRRCWHQPRCNPAPGASPRAATTSRSANSA